jgi:26S proteasome regulatory subunit N1
VEGSFQAAAVLGLALVANREEIGRQMLLRTFDHLMQYGELVVRRSVPLAMGLLHISEPDLTVMVLLTLLFY